MTAKGLQSRIEGVPEALDRAVHGLEALGPWSAGTRAGLACSGGADSTLLSLAWKRFARDRPLEARVWVVDHGHRPGTAGEAARAAALYRGLGFRAEVLRADPLAQGTAATEGALREARYQALFRAARASGIRVLLTAHQADDCAETVLLRILRGTGMRGLAGIPARRELLPESGIEVRRPLLGLRRAAIRRALEALDQPWIRDPTNEVAATGARNRLRLEVMPLLAGLAPGDPVEAILKLAGEAGEWNEALEQLLSAAGDWRALPSFLRRQAIAVKLREAGETVSPARLRDLEGALLTRGSAAISRTRRLRCPAAGGGLVVRPRRAGPD